MSRRPRVTLERGAAAHSRMATPLDDAAQRVSRAGDCAIRGPPHPRIGWGRFKHAAALPDAIERRRHAVFGGHCRRPHRAAAGAQASAHVARADVRRGLVTLDMGGTSADIAFIEDGAPLEVTESVIARRQVDVPALDMVTISAGGGSIAWIDGGGFLNVGPHSAGADPGPACYGRGGLEPTVTDADLVCGYLNPDYFLRRPPHLDLAT